jgi:hypothetical protein
MSVPPGWAADRESTGGVPCGPVCNVDDDSAEVRSRSHVLVGRMNLVEAEHRVDHWLDPVRRNGMVYHLEHLHRPDQNALQVGAASQDQPRIEFGRRPAQAADQANLTANADSSERARQRTGTADLDHVIDAKALTGQIAGLESEEYAKAISREGQRAHPAEFAW